MTFCLGNTSSFLSNAFGKFRRGRAYRKIFCWWEICIICASETPQIIDCRFFQHLYLWEKVSWWLPFLCFRASLKRFAFAFPFASWRKASPPLWGAVCSRETRDQPKQGTFSSSPVSPRFFPLLRSLYFSLALVLALHYLNAWNRLSRGRKREDPGYEVAPYSTS